MQALEFPSCRIIPPESFLRTDITLCLTMLFSPQHAAWEDKVAELNQITSARDTARDQHEELRKKRLSEFMAGFLVITNKLKEMYQVSLILVLEVVIVVALSPDGLHRVLTEAVAARAASFWKVYRVAA